MSPAPRMASLTWALRKRLAVWRVARSIVLRTAPRCSCILMMPSPSVLCSGGGLTIIPAADCQSGTAAIPDIRFVVGVSNERRAHS